MNAIIEYQRDAELFTALLDDGQQLSHGDPVELAKLLIEAGVAPGDAKWSVWSLQNKFEDIMKAVKKGDATWARMAKCELGIRMSF